MAEQITCPVCGASNSADQEFCQRCKSPLKPSAGSPIQPGQMPTKKNTAELEPILPQWLRDARDEARKTAQDQASQSAQESDSLSLPTTPSQDFLAGLQSQKGDDEEETPDWLASITGAKPTPKKNDNESTDVRWVELGKPDEFMPQDEETSSAPTAQEPAEPAQEGELPPWLADIQQPAEQGGVDELTSWLRQADSQAPQASPFTEEASESADEALPSSSEPLPDWLKSLQADQAAAEESQQTAAPEQIESDSDWLNKLQSPGQAAPPPTSTETPSWLKEDTTPAERKLSETPAWLRSSEASTDDEEQADEAEPAADLPDWLKAAAPQSSIFEEEPAAPKASGTDMPDWLNALQAEAGKTPEPEKPEEAPAFTSESLAGENANALFTEMPDWLSNTGEEAGAPETPSKQQEAESIAPGDLPSWVQAMRPVESSLLQSETGSKRDQTLETSGALAGLQGVLPAVPGIGPTSKPKAYSITLNATEEQLAQSTLLEQILAAETAPEPIASFAPLGTQRWLRWALAILLLVILVGAFFLQPGAYALPTGETSDLRDARLIMEALAPGAPILVVVDYEPALSGEMEAVAAPLLEHGIILKQPVLAFISTSPTGGSLAEHLMSGPLKDRGYQPGTQYLNLGYLPGGLSGVRAFAQDPRAAAQFDMDMNPAWNNPPLQEISSLSQFAAMIVITDNAESARTWIEQTADKRPTTPIIVVSSAQATPMIQPYYDSRQVSAIVSGLHGGSIVAQSNGDLPSLAKYYWNAFSLGLLLAVVLIVIGALWNFGLGLRERALEGK